MKTTRILLGLIVLLGAGFIIVGEQLTGASADAVINARLTTLRAPIAGTYDMPTKALGTIVAQGEEIGRMTDPLVDDIRLEDLLLERRLTEAERDRFTTQITAINDSVEILSERAQNYGKQRVEQLEAQIAAAESEAAAADARLEAAEGTRQRAEQLTGRGVSSAAVFEEATANARVATRALEKARSEKRVLEVQLRAARNGIFLGDSYNDAPYSEQRAEELYLRRNELEGDLDDASRRINALDQRIAAERRRVNRLSNAVILANVDGRLWEVLAADGERIQRGQEVARLVDCGSMMVTLSVSESVYNGLQIGDTAQFRINGETTVYDGTVSRLAGSGAETIYTNLAVAPSQKHLERYDVTLLVPALREGDGLSCAIGRTGRAFFSRRPLDVLRRMWADLPL